MALLNDLRQFKREHPYRYRMTIRLNLYVILPLIVSALVIVNVLGYGWLGIVSAMVFVVAVTAIVIPIFYRIFPYDPGAD